jgi:pimeloyl-ACP methyl ester carboxylesterase
VVGLLGLIALLVLGGAIYQAVGTAQDRQQYPAPGQRVDVGGYRLHLHVVGAGPGRPAVILENGSASMSAQWGWVQRQLAADLTVVAYDRPGQGYSDPAPAGLDARRLARDLHAALQQVGVPGPYITVGPSMGALLARSFAALYPDEVVGVVLVDPRYRDLDTDNTEIFQRAPAAPDASEPLFLRAMPILAGLGAARLIDPLKPYVDQLPPEEGGQARAAVASPEYWRSIYPDGQVGESAAALLAAQGDNLGDRPLIILSAGTPDMNFDPTARPRFTAMHARMAATLSTRGEQRLVPGADHQTIATNPQYAQAISDAVREVAARASR